MADVQLSPEASFDLDDIWEFGEREFGPDAADAYVFSFNEAFDLLARHPRAGAGHPAYGPHVRGMLHMSHRIYYEVADDRVYVLRILHHSRDAERHLN